MKTWITSDLHFGHANIMKYCAESRSRFNNDVEYMNARMIEEWNNLVAPEDVVYILGDVAFLPRDKAVKIVERLNGKKILIEGNHDTKLLKDSRFRQCFQSVHQCLSLHYNKKRIVMSHFPFLEWDKMHRGALHFFGHVHGGKTGQEHFRCRDVGMDASGRVVMLLDEAIASIENNQIKGHHGNVFE